MWISLGGDVVVDYALKIKSILGETTWVTAYADDVMAYIPSRRILQEGGYEGSSSMIAYGLPTYRWADDIEDRLCAAVEVLANRAKGK